MYNSVASSTFRILCNDHYCPFPELLRHPKEKLHTHETMAPIPSSPKLTATSILLLLSVDLPILSTSHRRDHTIAALFCLAYVTQHEGSFMLYLVSEYHSSFWLNNIPLYVDTTFYLSVHLLVNIWVVSTFL